MTKISYTLFAYDINGMFHVYRGQYDSYEEGRDFLLGRFHKDRIPMTEGCEPVFTTTKEYMQLMPEEGFQVLPNTPLSDTFH